MATIRTSANKTSLKIFNYVFYNRLFDKVLPRSRVFFTILKSYKPISYEILKQRGKILDKLFFFDGRESPDKWII